MVAGGGMKLMVLITCAILGWTVGKFSRFGMKIMVLMCSWHSWFHSELVLYHGGWSWNETDGVDLLWHLWLDRE
jgi:hypothetical protein